MTDKEKAKAYDEALERARDVKNGPCPHEASIAAVNYIFPELREGEDERIRKELIAAIDEGRVFDIDKEVADRWTAYLEKQKEQKPVEIHIDNPNIQKVNPDVKISTSDSSASGDELLYVNNKSYRLGYQDGKREAEQKPNIELIQRSWYMEGYHDREFGNEPKWVIKTGEGGPKHELNPRYGQPLAINYGMRLQKEQMLKDAVEGKVYFQMGGIKRVKSDDFENPDIHLGDKVKLIIVKED